MSEAYWSVDAPLKGTLAEARTSMRPLNNEHPTLSRSPKKYLWVETRPFSPVVVVLGFYSVSCERQQTYSHSP